MAPFWEQWVCPAEIHGCRWQKWLFHAELPPHTRAYGSLGDWAGRNLQESLRRGFWDNWARQFGQGMPLKLVGSPDTISRQIEEAHNRLGFDEVFFLIPQGIHSSEQIIESMDLITNQVMPRFN